MTTAPLPGTAAARRPIPPAATDAWRFVDSGVPREEAAAKLAVLHGQDRAVLEDAVRFWTRRMHQLPSDDFHATAVLRVLDAALRLVPRMGPRPRPS